MPRHSKQEPTYLRSERVTKGDGGKTQGHIYLQATRVHLHTPRNTRPPPPHTHTPSWKDTEFLRLWPPAPGKTADASTD
jgi:hypothetical protein